MPSLSSSPPGPRRTLRPRTAGSAVAVLGSLALAFAPSIVSAAPQDDPTGPARTVVPGSVDLPLDGAPTSPSQLRDEPREVFVQLSGKGAADAAQQAHGRSAKARAAHAAKDAARNKGQQVLARAQGLDPQAEELWSVGNAVPGIAISADSDALRAVAQMDQVVRVSALVPKHPVNSNGAELTNVLRTWQDTGTYGDGVTIGIIDTGTDYTHSDLGGQGTTDAWNAARAAATSADWRDGLTDLAAAKVLGGFDFSGDDYNADPTAADYQPTPHPDENPIDCYGHGSHVAGIAAGYGENADGSTFTGSYGDLTSSDLEAMKISPGTAPRAEIYSLKVFGCTGSTNVVIPALDWALDPDGDGDFSDHLDIVNLSLGSDYATVDDPENAVVNNLAEHGVLPVIAMGNGGDLTDIGGSPGNAVRSLAVASSVDDYQLLDGLRVDSPADVAGVSAGQNSIAYDWANEAPVTGAVVALGDPANADGCDPLGAADAAAVAGKVAWLTWDSDDGTRRCGSAGRSANVRAAGAIGAVFTGDVSPFTAGISGDPVIPVFQLTKASTEKLQPAMEAGTLTVTFDGSLALTVKDVDPSITDLVSSFSSRGTHGSLGVVKPDVAAPGDSIVSIGVGSGDGALSESGTSMATPHTAGIAALVKETHPDWTVEQIKADIMNTAAHDVFSEPDRTGDVYGPARVGAGRIDAAAAVGNTVLAYSEDTPGGVSASFGVVAVPFTDVIARTRDVTVENTGDTAATLEVSYDAAVEQPGVSYSVSPKTLTVAPGQTAHVRVSLVVRSELLRHSLDPTMAAQQLGLRRQYVSDASGRLVLTTAEGQDLRVPVYAAAKPTSQTTASVVTTGHGKKATSRIDYSGTGFLESPSTDEFVSMTTVSTLGEMSPQLPACAGSTTTGCTVNQSAVAGDLQYVGAGSSPSGTGGYADGWLWFSMATYGDWATVGNSTIPYVDFDTTGDGVPDYEVYAQNYPDTDVLFAILVDLRSGAVVDLEPVNFTFGESNVFDTNVLNIPVWPAMIGVTDETKSFPITYRVGTFSIYTNNPGGDIDSAGPVSYDVVAPDIAPAYGLYLDYEGTSIDLGHVGLNKSGAPHCKGHCPDKRFKALVLHLHGASGERAQVLSLP